MCRFTPLGMWYRYELLQEISLSNIKEAITVLMDYIIKFMTTSPLWTVRHNIFYLTTSSVNFFFYCKIHNGNTITETEPVNYLWCLRIIHPSVNFLYAAVIFKTSMEHNKIHRASFQLKSPSIFYVLKISMRTLRPRR